MVPPAGRPTRTSKYAVPRATAADQETVHHIARLLADAERPLLITAKTGRYKGGFEAVSRLAELTGTRVVDTPESGCLNIATTHPMAVRSSATARRLVAVADLIIVADCDVPWIPKFTSPRDDATIVQIDAEPLRTDMPLWDFPADLSVAARGVTVLGQVANRLPDLDPTAKWASLDTEEEVAVSPATDGPISAHEVAEALNAVLRDDDVLVEEAVTNAGALHDVLRRSLPGTLAGTGSPGLGWGLGGAVGVKLARPDRRVVAVVGDGSFMFGVPTAAFALAAEADAPIAVVVLNNDGYRASRLPVFELFPDGVSAGQGDAVGTRFRRPPDFAAVARACHAHGETVDVREELVPALWRALKALEAGSSAVVDVHIAPN
jgi:acetolactate synthase-1/2/3 large subunit